jgi:hypothetical protein
MEPTWRRSPLALASRARSRATCQASGSRMNAKMTTTSNAGMMPIANTHRQASCTGM